ncbi:zinc-dependent alcohol dehydrogenase [Gordonia hydrophobica]|uniref:Alcohol dehydrogenase catalytic domain-containing protein n=1 Tax=Gordonia hydrophobica TaxID=40516 RepID=A0ABZ2U7I8_9ACTN|nr:alcohol dehydrogenase catalytic domain-containing protein [Gordonia hydrophobica]MBM7365355.1 alcohol dehydrogenase [Gordonia hydrophobica]
MRELMYTGRWTTEWREAKDPTVDGPGEAIVAPVAATTCDVDSQILAGHGPIPAPFALGHECVARVIDVADDVSVVEPGQLAVVPWSISCGTCDQCRAGHTAHCTSVPDMAMYGTPIGGEWGGLLSDLVKVPYADAMLVPLPHGLDPIAMASASDNWTLAWRLVAPHLRRLPGASVLVMARGSIGLYVCDIARALGASEVVYVSPNEEHRALAARYGARTLAETQPIPKGFDLAVEATGRVDQLAVAAQSLKPEGFCESAGNHFRPGELPLLNMYLNSMSLRIARDNVRPNIPAALDLAASGTVTPRDVVSDVFGWDEIPERLPERHAKPVFVRDLT